MNRLLVALLVALPAAAGPAAESRTVAESRVAWADIDHLAVFNALGLDSNQCAALIPIVSELHAARAEADALLAQAERAELANLQALHAGLIEGRQLSPEGLAILARLDQAAIEAETARADALLTAYGRALEQLTEAQRDLIRSKDATAADDERAAFIEAIQRQRAFATRRATIQATLLDLANRARATADASRFRQVAGNECLARAAALTGLPAQHQLTRQLAGQYLQGLTALRDLSPLEFRQRANGIVGTMADATMYVVVTTQGVGETRTRIPAERLEAALVYARTPELLQHLVRERPAAARAPG